MINSGQHDTGAQEDSQDNSDGSAQRTPFLDRYCRDLKKLALKNKIDPVIGRKKEIERVIQILLRRTKNNPVLIGEPGVGKTAVAEGLAIRMAEGVMPKLLADKRVMSLSMTSLVAGAKYRGEFEERLKNIIDEFIQRNIRSTVFHFSFSSNCSIIQYHQLFSNRIEIFMLNLFKNIND